MPEKQKPFENRELTELTPRPNLQDIVKIDGRWAQVTSGGNLIVYLDDESATDINWDNYNCQFFDKYKKADRTNVWVRDLVEEGQITQDEYERVVWSSRSEPTTEPNKQSVTVFGIYTKK